MRVPAEAPDIVTEDSLLGGALRIVQTARGHRAGTDAILLAASIPASARGIAVDVGSGVGTVGLAMALRIPGLRVVLLEREAADANFARANVVKNALSDRARVAHADLFDAEARRENGIENGAAQIVVTNPPWFKEAEVRASPSFHREQAHVENSSVQEWLKAAVALLAPKGTFAMIHIPSKLPAILQALQGRLGNVSIMPIHPRAGEAAHRVLIRGIKGSRAPLSLRPPLIIHGGDHRFTARAENLHRGLTEIDWS